MKNLHYSICLAFVFMLLFTSCATDDDNYESIPSQNILESQIVQLYGSKNALIQPLATDFNLIPYDINNPLTEIMPYYLKSIRDNYP